MVDDRGRKLPLHNLDIVRIYNLLSKELVFCLWEALYRIIIVEFISGCNSS